MPSTVSTAKSIPLGAVLEHSGGGVRLGELPLHVPATVEAQIRETIGRRWRVPFSDVRLEWGSAPDERVIDARARFRLVGEGNDGWFAVIFRNPGAPGAAIRLRVGIDRRIPIAARRLFAGRIVGDEDIVFEKVTYSGRPAQSAGQTVEPGWRVMNDVDPGDQLRPPDVLPERVISAGESVRLRWRRGVVTVALEGVAVHDAVLGERVTVSLRGGRGESSGIVVGPGEATLDG